MKAIATVAAVLGLTAPLVAAYTDDALKDLVTNLPGTQGLEIPFKQFSGYLDIPGTSGSKTKHMHYWLAIVIHYVDVVYGFINSWILLIVI